MEKIVILFEVSLSLLSWLFIIVVFGAFSSWFVPGFSGGVPLYSGSLWSEPGLSGGLPPELELLGLELELVEFEDEVDEDSL